MTAAARSMAKATRRMSRWARTWAIAGHLRTAIAALRGLGSVEAISSFYETTPVGLVEQPDFLNAVAALRTTSPPQELMRRCCVSNSSMVAIAACPYRKGRARSIWICCRMAMS